MPSESSSSPPYDELVARFTASDLGTPLIPLVFRDSLSEREAWLYASRDMQAGPMYGFHDYLEEAVVGEVENYVAVSHAGHGANSYAINYHLVYGRLAVFARTLWGGVYSDQAADAGRVTAQMTRIARLLDAYEGYAAAELMPAPPARLVVIESDVGGDRVCRWLSAPLDQEEASQWLQTFADSDDRPTQTALDYVTNPELSPRDGD